MTALLLAAAAAYGLHLLWSAQVLGWRGLGPGPSTGNPHRRRGGVRRWLVQAGLDDVEPTEFLAVAGFMAAMGGMLAFATFGSPVPALMAAGFAGSFPVATYRNLFRGRLSRAQEAWPRIIEEIRILTGSVGRSIPQALFEAGRRGPQELHSAFDAAHREWLLSTDFTRTVGVLKARLADPTADAACETLLVAHDIGGADLDRRLEALADDRIQDLQGRKDARAKQAGVRFARWFVLAVPFGMALAGMNVGTGRAAYQTPEGQLAVAVGMVLVLVCWGWAGRIMRIPEEQRVFDR